MQVCVWQDLQKCQHNSKEFKFSGNLHDSVPNVPVNLVLLVAFFSISYSRRLSTEEATTVFTSN